MAPHDALSEFDLIKQYFVRQRPAAPPWASATIARC
jgi:hypothetical protein